MTTNDRLEWRTSSYSSNGEHCVEVAPVAGWRDWRTSSYSSNGEHCVEVASATGWHDSASGSDSENREGATSRHRAVFVRHSKHPDAGIIEFSPASWTTFLHEVRVGAASQNGSASVTFDGAETLVEAAGTGVRLQFDEGEWTAFLAGIEDGEFDTTRFGR